MSFFSLSFRRDRDRHRLKAIFFLLFFVVAIIITFFVIRGNILHFQAITYTTSTLTSSTSETSTSTSTSTVPALSLSSLSLFGSDLNDNNNNNNVKSMSTFSSLSLRNDDVRKWDDIAVLYNFELFVNYTQANRNNKINNKNNNNNNNNNNNSASSGRGESDASSTVSKLDIVTLQKIFTMLNIDGTKLLLIQDQDMPVLRIPSRLRPFLSSFISFLCHRHGISSYFRSLSPVLRARYLDSALSDARLSVSTSSSLLSSLTFASPLYDNDSLPKPVSHLIHIELPIGGRGIVSHTRKLFTIDCVRMALMLKEGDLVETGVFIGTSVSIMMRMVLDYDVSGLRRVYAFDSFEGLPPVTSEDSGVGDAGAFRSSYESFVTNMKFAKVYDETRLIVTRGWFSDTLPSSPVSAISFLRLDGDLYISTRDALVALYHRVVEGGVIYIDDFGSFPGARRAVIEFRTLNDITETMHWVQEPFRDCFEAVAWVKQDKKGTIPDFDSNKYPILTDQTPRCELQPINKNAPQKNVPKEKDVDI